MVFRPTCRALALLALLCLCLPVVSWTADDCWQSAILVVVDTLRGAYGSERHDLAGDRPRIAARLRERLREVDRTTIAPAAHGVELDSDTHEQPRALGYLD